MFIEMKFMRVFYKMKPFDVFVNNQWTHNIYNI
jgi:hypothetical protein